MTSTLLTGISELWTLDPALDDPARPGQVTEEQVLREAALVIEDGRVAWTGPAPANDADPIDALRRRVLSLLAGPGPKRPDEHDLAAAIRAAKRSLNETAKRLNASCSSSPMPAKW